MASMLVLLTSQRTDCGGVLFARCYV